MTQHTQPVVAAQHLTTQQQQQTTTTPNSNNNNNNNQSNNNNVSSASTTTTAPPSTTNNQTQTVAVQQQQQQHQNNNNNNNYQTQQNVSGPVYNPQLQPGNVFVPAHNIPAHHHPQHHHQPGAMYQTMIPAALPSNVYVNNVTANVNLHGWAHTVPHSAWVHPGSAQHYIHGELPPEQGAPVMQPMTAMPVTLPNPNALTGPLMNHNVNAISGGSRGSRRGRGRVGSSGSRRSDYNAAQRHPPPEGSPVPQSTGQSGQQDLQQQQQSSDSQQMLTAVPQSYVPHPQYAAQYPYGYPAFFAPPQHMLHPGQSAAAQQATGTPLYFPTMPVYNGHPLCNYGYFPVLNQAEYQYVPGDEVGVGVPVGDERQAGAETGAMMWHQQPIYTDEYGNMSSADMHAISSDDINHTSSSMGSAAETPNLLSPNYAPIYDPQMQEQMTQQMGVMQIYDDPQMGQIQVMHPQSGVSQMEDELSECGSQPSSHIQMVAPMQLVPSSATQMSLTTANTEQIMHHQAPHLIPATGAAAIMPTESNIASNTTPIQHQIQQQQSLTEDNTIDNSSHVQSYENVAANIQSRESVTSSTNEELEQKPAENLAQQDYHKQQQQQHQHQQQQQIQIQTQNVVVEAVQTDNYNSNRTIITEVQEVVVQEQKPLTKTDVAIETVLASSHTNIVKPQQQQQQQTVYSHQAQEKQQKHQQHHQQQQYAAKQHQQLQTQSVAPQQQTTNQQQQGGHYQQQQQPQQQQQHHQQTSYENRKSSQMYNPQHQSRRKYDYHHGHSSTGSNSSNNESSSNTQQHHQQQQTTKTMSWTNSAQHKKSTNTVAVTATPTSSHTGAAGSYNKSSSNATNSTSTHSHTTRTYTNQQHHNYQQQQNPQQQQQQQNYHYQQQQQHQPQTRNYGAMKMPSSPIASVTNPMERKTSQTRDAGKSHAQQQQQQQHQQQQTTSTASTTAVPHQFQQQQQQQSQQTSTTDVVQHPTQSSISSSSSIVANTAATTVPATTTNISKSQQQQQYPPGFANKKHSLSNQGHTTSGNNANAANLSAPAATETATSAPAINLAPPVTATTPAVPSTPSWASLFSSNSANSNNTPAASAANTSANILSSNASSATYAKKPVAKVAPYEVLAPVTPTAPLVTPGALSYSAASAQNLPPPPSASSSSTSSATAAKKVSGDQTLSQRNSMANLDEFSLKFAEFLTKYKSDWATISLRPRGLTNRSNYCYINSILQALLGCSPLYNLIRSIPKQAANLCEVKTPTVNAMITFMSNFSNLPSGLRLRNPKGSKNNKDDLGSDLQCDPAFEPTEIYKLWNDSREEHVEGRQEDAEEFLSYILNKLNDEMLEVIKLIAKPTPEQNGQNEPPEEEGDAWQMICNNRNKGSVTRQTDFGCTPLSDIFRGELRSRLQREGELSTDVIQPFFTLQLNIEKAASVKEALEILVGRDQLEGVTGSKSKQEVVAWQQMNLEKLPPILILHLKWFDYRSDGCTKILKKVDFPVELKIDAKILASKKYSQKQRAYRLFAVVYHDGKEATKGHYITDVYHTGYGSWLRYDDSSVKPVSENHVLLPRAPRVPYLLCYRRCDTIPQQSNNNQNSSGGNNNNHSSSGNTTQSSGK